MTTPVCPSYAGYRFPAEIISHAVWLYFRFPLSLRMVEEMLAARGIIVSHESVRQWALKFGQDFANQIRRRLRYTGDKWHHHASNNLAKLPFDPSVRVPRARLRPRYGDGFGGAPLTVHRPQSEGRAAGGGANGAARQGSSARAGADEP